MLNEQLTRGHSVDAKKVTSAPIQNIIQQNNPDTNSPTSTVNTDRNRVTQNFDVDNKTVPVINSEKSRILQNIPSGGNTVKQTEVPLKAEPQKETTFQVQKVAINSTPTGLEVYIDSIKVGLTPFNTTLTTGNHLVRLQLGVQKVVKNINVVKAHGETNYDFDLSPRSFNESVNGINFTMVFIKGGTFRMGTNDGRSIEKPVHTVDIESFYMCDIEVTQALFKSIMEYNVSNNKGDELPSERVCWNEAQEFIQKLNVITGKNYRLPTESEWEYCASTTPSGSKSTWSGTNNEKKLGDYAWYADNSEGKTHPGKQKMANEWGLYDMTGNVWEWCSDWFGEYNNNSRNNPSGPSSGTTHVNRGGGWDDDGPYSRATNRDDNNPEDHFSTVGFRLAHSTK